MVSLSPVCIIKNYNKKSKLKKIIKKQIYEWKRIGMVENFAYKWKLIKNINYVKKSKIVLLILNYIINPIKQNMLIKKIEKIVLV